MLRLNNLHAGYDKKSILKGVNLEVKSGEFLALVGLNGSGKSTLLKTALGLLKIQKGSVAINEISLSQIPLGKRAQQISLLESQVDIQFPMTVRELISLGAKVFKDFDEAWVKKLLNTVGLEGFENRNLFELSSGEVRRAFIAHTLSTRSQIVLLDEPFSHLDWRHQRELAESLMSWRKEFGTTFVAAIHELEWVPKVSDRVAVLHNGEIIICDAAPKVFSDPRVCEVFAFQTRIDENPLDGSKRLTLAPPAK